MSVLLDQGQDLGIYLSKNVPGDTNVLIWEYGLRTDDIENNLNKAHVHLEISYGKDEVIRF